MHNVTRVVFKPVFENELHLLANTVCEQCDAEIRHPLLPWLVGDKFSDSAERILFVGKPHRGTPGEILPSGMIDPTDMVAKSLWDFSSPYWSYTREIAENLYGPNAQDFIALTNLIKCTNTDYDEGKSSAIDQTTVGMATCCVLKLGVVWKEIERLRPTTIVFYTHAMFPEVLQEVPVAIDGTIREITPRDHRVVCRNKRLPWWERSCRTCWSENLRLLVIGHPERMGRPEFVDILTNWLRPKPAL